MIDTNDLLPLSRRLFALLRLQREKVAVKSNDSRFRPLPRWGVIQIGIRVTKQGVVPSRAQPDPTRTAGRSRCS